MVWPVWCDREYVCKVSVWCGLCGATESTSVRLVYSVACVV